MGLRYDAFRVASLSAAGRSGAGKGYLQDQETHDTLAPDDEQGELLYDNVKTAI